MARKPKTRSRSGARPAPRQVNIHEAKTQFSKLVERAEAGEEIIIARDGQPCARLVPLAAGSRRSLTGKFAGQIWMADDFMETPQDVIDSFYDSKFP
ncbi:MAG: type II toxin-antitoxin system Phd/YefM family antitoxin [Planctomycetes bacterium]|nr:type II toxin-antitoxin system Phd/YefM family antitoxin [Planctomycetota bacterium]